MGLDMFLEVLRTLERLAAELAAMWLQGDMDTDVRRDMVALDHGDVAIAPCTL